MFNNFSELKSNQQTPTLHLVLEFIQRSTLNNVIFGRSPLLQIQSLGLVFRTNQKSEKQGGDSELSSIPDAFKLISSRVMPSVELISPQ